MSNSRQKQLDKEMWNVFRQTALSQVGIMTLHNALKNALCPNHKQDGFYQHFQDNLDQLIKWSDKCRCYLILVNVTQATGMKMYII